MEKQKLEDGVAEINELVLADRKDGDDRWERHRALLLS